MRTFIALDLPGRFRFELAGLARVLDGRVDGRFVEPGAYHVTLAFLGDVDERNVASAMAAMDAALAGFAPVELIGDGLGKFGKADDATLWLGLKMTENLSNLASAVRGELSARDVRFDGKPFVPHVTLARRASIPAADLGPLPFPEPDEATSVTLFKSELDADGAVYAPLYTVELG